MISTQLRAARRPLASAGSLLRALTVAALLLPALVGVGASSAHAAGYRYWSFWTAEGSGPWNYSSVGAASTRPQDGDVQGWRFAVSAGASSSTIAPRPAASFAALCGDQPAPADRKRVGLVVDFGTRADAPAGETPPASRTFCVEAPLKASGAAVLLQALSVRTKDGLVCGINGYPRTECAVVVNNPKPVATTTSEPSTTAAPAGSARRATAAAEANGGKKVGARVQPKAAGQPPAAVRTSAPSAAPSTSPAPSSAPTLVTDATPVAAETSGGSPWGVLIAAVLLALAAGTAVLLKRRPS